MKRIAIHQPNFLPWPGYFAKLAQADLFVLLDDAQFSKNNIINRVRILGETEPRWLTLPVAAHLGQSIAQTLPAKPDWRRSILALLRNTYGKAAYFKAIWPSLESWFAAAPEADLAAINTHFIAAIAGYLDVATPLQKASMLGIAGQSDDRLVMIVQHLAPGGCYLSGKGGAGYQDPAKFSAAGLALEYYSFTPRAYDQGRPGFQPGLSVLDPLFHLGRDGCLDLIHGR